MHDHEDHDRGGVGHMPFGGKLIKEVGGTRYVYMLV